MLRGTYIVCALAALNGFLPPAGELRQTDADPLDELLARHAISPIAGEAFASAVGSPNVDGPSLSFLVGGHLYGNPKDRERVQPAASFTSRVNELRALEPDFFVSLGDVFRNFVEPTVEGTLATLDELRLPVYNAVGNHDVGRSREGYDARFGPAFGGFRIGASLFLILDTERVPWQISGPQLDFVTRALTLAPEAGIQSLFVFSHRVLFAAGDERYRVVFLHCNSRAGWPGSSNFGSDLRPLLAAFREVGEVTWFAGDVGAPGSYGLFVDRDPETGVRYVAVGLGEEDWDSLIQVRVDETGAVSLERVPLRAPEWTGFDECGLAAWNERFPPKRFRRRKPASPPASPPSDEGNDR